MVIGHDLVGRHSIALDSLPKEGLGTGRVAVLAQEHVDDHAILIDRSIEISFLSCTKQEDLVDEPGPANWTPTTSDLIGQPRSEGLHPIENGAMRHVNSAFSQQLDDLPA